jgi:hypothetical protein
MQKRALSLVASTHFTQERPEQRKRARSPFIHRTRLLQQEHRCALLPSLLLPLRTSDERLDRIVIDR